MYKKTASMTLRRRASRQPSHRRILQDPPRSKAGPIKLWRPPRGCDFAGEEIEPELFRVINFDKGSAKIPSPSEPSLSTATHLPCAPAADAVSFVASLSPQSLRSFILLLLFNKPQTFYFLSFFLFLNDNNLYSPFCLYLRFPHPRQYYRIAIASHRSMLRPPQEVYFAQLVSTTPSPQQVVFVAAGPRY